MKPKKLIVVDKSDEVNRAESLSAYANDIISGAQINDQMVQNLLLIWLD